MYKITTELKTYASTTDTFDCHDSTTLIFELWINGFLERSMLAGMSLTEDNTSVVYSRNVLIFE